MITLLAKRIVGSILNCSKQPKQLKNESSCTQDEFFNGNAFDISKATNIGKIKMISPRMKVCFELQIDNIDNFPTDAFVYLLFVQPWFDLRIRKSAECSKYYISHTQYNGLGKHREIRKYDPIDLTNRWQTIVVKNSLEIHGTIKTSIEIEGEIVFNSKPYTWEHPHIDETSFDVEIGDNNDLISGQIRNVRIVCHK